MSGAIAKKGTLPAVDPLELLKREHEMILGQLSKLEDEARGEAGGGAEGRRRLRAVLRFFTKTIGIHFKREAILFSAMARAMGAEGYAFRAVACEHHALKEGASSLSRALRLGGRRLTGGSDAGSRDFRRKVKAFTGLYRWHIAYEERVLFVTSAMHLGEFEKGRIAGRMLEV